MGKLTISMAIFNSYVKLPEGFFAAVTDSYLFADTPYSGWSRVYLFRMSKSGNLTSWFATKARNRKMLVRLHVEKAINISLGKPLVIGVNYGLPLLWCFNPMKILVTGKLLENSNDSFCPGFNCIGLSLLLGVKWVFWLSGKLVLVWYELSRSILRTWEVLFLFYTFPWFGETPFWCHVESKRKVQHQ
jgi:hypothetical protein